ncbi:MAG: hypothetical protein ACJAZS_000369 [Alteromonas naphthalenivorans]|jgi:hypothetical protein
MKKILFCLLLVPCFSVPACDKASLNPDELEEILNALDLIVEELPVFLEQYELASNLSWKEWKKKYWLLAPIGAGVLTLKFYFRFNAIFYNHQNSTLPKSIGMG